MRQCRSKDQAENPKTHPNKAILPLASPNGSTTIRNKITATAEIAATD
jgi:hypothetical protein